MGDSKEFNAEKLNTASEGEKERKNLKKIDGDSHFSHGIGKVLIELFHTQHINFKLK